jgi:hypothetical protein
VYKGKTHTQCTFHDAGHATSDLQFNQTMVHAVQTWDRLDSDKDGKVSVSALQAEIATYKVNSHLIQWLREYSYATWEDEENHLREYDNIDMDTFLTAAQAVYPGDADTKWCATAVDHAGVVLDNQWGYCSRACSSGCYSSARVHKDLPGCDSGEESSPLYQPGVLGRQCRRFQTLSQAKDFCNRHRICTGVVHVSPSSPSSSPYEVRSGTLLRRATALSTIDSGGGSGVGVRTEAATASAITYIKQSCGVTFSAKISFVAQASVPAGGSIIVAIKDDSWGMDESPAVHFLRPGSGKVRGSAVWDGATDTLTITTTADGEDVPAGGQVTLQVVGVTTMRSLAPDATVTIRGTHTPNLALLKPATQSSTARAVENDGVASLAVDGTTNTDQNFGSCTLTGKNRRAIVGATSVGASVGTRRYC